MVTYKKEHIEETNHYYPFGGLMGDSRSTATQPYKYIGKELDRTHGLDWYDHGARHYDPVTGRWNVVDAMAEKYYPWSPYVSCGDDPVIELDADGNKIIFVNGKIGCGSPAAGAPYWNGAKSVFINRAKKILKDNKVFFTNKDYSYLSGVETRRKSGYEYARRYFRDWISDMENNETFKIVSHSMGGAFAMGIDDYIKEQGKQVVFNIMINTFQVDQIRNSDASNTIYIDYQNTDDPVLFWFDVNMGRGKLQNADILIRKKSNVEYEYKHRSPIDTGNFWEEIKEKLNRNLK